MLDTNIHDNYIDNIIARQDEKIHRLDIQVEKLDNKVNYLSKILDNILKKQGSLFEDIDKGATSV